MASTWEHDFRQHVSFLADLGSDIHYDTSAEKLRQLLQTGPLRQTDIRDAPERFFLAHKVLSEYATKLGPGFGIRFTVQFNLFAGTIIGLGNQEQVAALDKMQAEGRLGCFCLTERGAGVNSGLVVNTQCVWDEARQVFILNSEDEGAVKNWISQGLTADACVVIANLVVGGKSHGPHGFFMEMRQAGQLVPGVEVGDMGPKTIGNDLDNAWVTFKDATLPASALLDRYGGIEQGVYKPRVNGVSTMDMIGQRLYTGRTVIASSTLVFARSLFAKTREYCDNKQCWAPKGHIMLSDIPQLHELFREADQRLGQIEAFGQSVEMELSGCLREDRLPSSNLVEAVAVYKVRAIETSIDLCFKLKQEVGSYALMGGAGFEKMDYLQCCKFAEGDSRILMQKIARDRLQAFSKKQEGTEAESKLCMELGQALMAGGKKAWGENWQKIYGLSEMVMDRVVHERLATSRL